MDPVLRGEKKLCFMQTEPDAGSDPAEQEKALSALKQIGANIEKVRPHRDGVSYSINVFDPDGNRWELSFAQGN